MKRTLLIAACSLFLTGTQAFAADQQKWSKSVENTVSKWEELNLQAPTLWTMQATPTPREHSRNRLSSEAPFLTRLPTVPICQIRSNGNALWAVGLRGAATITAITTDEQNNVYVAGTLADAVEVGSTDGKAQTVNGKAGEVENQVSSFIAAYSAEGALKATKSFGRKQCRNSFQWALLSPRRISIYKNQPHRSKQRKLYASAMYTGDVTIDNVQ